MKRSTTKRALWLSVLSMFLCLTMFMGTTFAWFTDEVTSGTNTIVAGNLDVELYNAIGVDANNKVDTNTKLFELEAPNLWEPGAVVYENLTVANHGNLALKYKLSLNIGNAQGGKSLADVLKIAIVPGGFTGDREAAKALTNYQAFETEVLRDTLLAGADADHPTTKTYGLVIYWEPSTVDNDYNMNNDNQDKELSIDFGVKLFATQLEAEKDSFDEHYDAEAGAVVIDNLDNLQAAIDAADEGDTIMIAEGDYVLNAQININKSINVIGKGTVNILNKPGSRHMFMVSNYYGTTNDMTVNMKNLNLDGKDGYKNAGIYAKYNVVLNLENVTCKNTEWADIQIDNANTHSDGKYYSGTKTIVNAKNVEVEDVALIALPTTLSGVTYKNEAHFNYDTSSIIGAIEKQNNLDPKSMYVNGDNSGEAEKQEYEYTEAASESDVANAITNATPDKTTVITLADGTYAGDIDLTVAAVGESKGDFIFRAAEGTSPVIEGTVTLGYRNQGVGATMWNGDVVFEGVTFDHATGSTHSLDVQDVKSLTLKNCTIIGDGEYGLTSARGNGTGTSTIIGCTFENAGMQLLGNFATGLVIEDCIFNNSCINVQAGNGVTVKDCEFNYTVTDTNVGDSFYMIRSNSTPITVEKCEINVDSAVTGIASAQAKWGILWNRGTTNWTVSDVTVTMTDAAVAQTEILVTKCTSTGAINTTNLTVNGVLQ